MSAPIGGTIIQRKVGLGQYINVGATDPVFTVGNLSTVWLIANVRESDAPKMKVGAAVEVTVLAFPGRVFNAKLAYVAPALDPNTRRLPVRAEIQNTGRELLPEMFASFRIVSGDDRLMPAVPVDAIVYEGAKARVWIARPDSKTVVSRDIDGRRHDQRPGRGAQGPRGRRDRGDQRHAVHRPRRPARLSAASPAAPVRKRRAFAMHAIVAAALKQRVLVIILGVTMMVGGLFAYRTLNIEAYPDPVPPLVDIITQNPGQSSEEIERYITVPIEIQMAGLPYVQAIRTISLFGLSRREGAVHLRRDLPAGLADGDQPPDAARRPAQRRAAGAVADQPDRRDLPLPRGRSARLLASPTSRPSRTGSCSAASRRSPA